MNKIQIFLLILIIIGLGLLATQKIWVPKLVEKIISAENLTKVEPQKSTSEKVGEDSSKINEKLYSPENRYYAIQKYVKSEQVTCCGNDEPFEKKSYSVSVFESDGDKLVKEFTEFNLGNFQGYTPSIDKWYSEDILQMHGEGVVDAFSVFYDVSENKLIPEWEVRGDEDLGWQHYVNPKYGFEFNYPYNYSISNPNEYNSESMSYLEVYDRKKSVGGATEYILGISFGSKDESIMDQPAWVSLEDFVNRNIKNDKRLISMNRKVINGKDAVEAIFSFDGGNSKNIYFFQHGKIFSFSWQPVDDNASMDKIVSSVKFFTVE